MPPLGTKRDPPMSTNSESSWNTVENKNIAKRMKHKKSSVTFSEVSDQLEPAKSHINKHTDKYPLDTQKLTEYLVEAYDNPNTLDLTLKYTNDNLALDKMLIDKSAYITVNKFKNRIKRLQTRLNTIRQNYLPTTLKIRALTKKVKQNETSSYTAPWLLHHQHKN